MIGNPGTGSPKLDLRCYLFNLVRCSFFEQDDNWINFLLQSTEEPEENVADSAYTILFTVDLNNGAGLIHAGSYLDKYEKPADGFPFIK